MDASAFSQLEVQEYAKYIERVRSSKRASKRNAPALELSQLILQEYHQRGRLEMLRELIQQAL